MQVPAPDCALCPRLVAFRKANQNQFPDWFNGAVPAFGPLDAPILIVGLAPGLRGANCTGRPFTGDWAGDLLYPTLLTHGMARGRYGARPDDGLCLTSARITNAVRCVPPQNKPVGAEINACNGFLADEIAAMGRLRAVLALGTVAHGAVLAALGRKKSAVKFGHAKVHDLGPGPVLVDSYHCSRYNTNTGRLTPKMFNAVFAELRKIAIR